MAIFFCKKSTKTSNRFECFGENVTIYAKVVEGYTFTLELPNETIKIPVEKNGQFDLSTVEKIGYTFTGWQVLNGSVYTDLTNLVVTATQNSTFKPTVETATFTITYNMNGGTNPASNKTSYTVNDTIILATPAKEGYMFVKFVDASGRTVEKIEKGTTGDLALEAIFIKDEFKTSANVTLSEVAQEIPNFVIPETAFYTVSITYNNQPVAVQNGKAVFNQLGNYVAIYKITLSGGTVLQKVVVLTASKLTLTLDGSYNEQYALNSELLLLDAFCEKATAFVSVKVTKDGQEVKYNNFTLKLTELGVYTVTYTIEGEIADTLSVSFEVVQKVSGSKTAKATTASLVEGGSGAGLLIACIGCVVGNHCGKGRDRNLYRKNKKEKGEN